MPINKILQGDSLTVLKTLPDESVHCVITSPPYFGLRDYGVEGQLGLEKTPDAFIEAMTEVFEEVRRVLRSDGTLWLNIGDSYATSTKGGRKSKEGDKNYTSKGTVDQALRVLDSGVKSKDLVGIPWMLAFALRASGWYLRQDIIWSKPNPMPESVQDRCTKAHEYVFMMSKSARYYYDAKAIREEGKDWSQRVGSKINATEHYGGVGQNGNAGLARLQARYKALPEGQANIRQARDKQRGHGRRHEGFNERWDAMAKSGQVAMGANKRSVWHVATMPFKGAHFATFPEKLIEPMILAGAPPKGIVLDPFMGAGTTALVAKKLGRQYLGIELNPEYIAIAEKRLRNIPDPLF